MEISEGKPYPLGATADEKGANFAVFSANATRVEVCFFDTEGRREIGRFELPERTDEVFHGHVTEVGPATLYGFRVHGPYEPEAGHRFNPNKLLLDPYARAHSGKLTWNPAVFGYTIGAKGDDLSFDKRDSAPFVPKSVIVDPNFDWHGEYRRRSVPWEGTIVYETHVKGFTKLHPEVDKKLRGFYAGLGSKPVVDYIKSLGVTTVELMPIHTFIDDDYLLEKGLKNYWGYNSIGFFAPDPRYASDVPNSLREFKEMIARLHDGGLEVILDVVYNHTAEGNERGATLSFKGIDNKSYYRLMPDEPRFYINDTGTGNTVNLSHPRVIQMVADSLRYWVTETRVDGFRFDLGTILAREPDGFNTESGFLKVVGQDPVLADVKLIAEPWDLGPGGYQVGGFPPGWAEWNDRFRDDVRDFWRGHSDCKSAGASPLRFTGQVQLSRPKTLGERQLHRRSRWLHAQRPRFLQRQAQRGERRGQSRRTLGQPLMELRRGGADQRQGHPNVAMAPASQPPGDAHLVAGHSDDLRRRRVRSHAERQQQCLLPGQRDELDPLGDG